MACGVVKYCKCKFAERRSGVMNGNNIQYENMNTQKLTDDMLKECASLFSTNYGNYSESSEIRPGEEVRMSAAYYKKNYCLPDFYVALARDERKIVGQAFYIRKKYNDIGVMTWVVQLVVDKNYRRMGVASTLLRSIWGFSDDYAWGLATANPCTVKTLESATFRTCNTRVIKSHIDEVSRISDDVGFAKEGTLEVSEDSSQINSHFSVDNSGYAGIAECEEKLGKLKSGREWLAFTFQDQSIDLERYKRKFNDLIAFSESKLRDAYSRMLMDDHPWAKGAEREIEFILSYIGPNGSMKAVDLGCGTGRHSIELARRGMSVHGVDFSENNIRRAREKAKVLENCIFTCEDVREYAEKEEYDLALCLYDVIGLFPAEEDNRRIIENAYGALKPGGYFVISVMNMELTEYLVPDSNKGIVSENPELLLNLKPGNIMQKTGDIFDPEYIVIDTVENLVYRKEQFVEDERLPAEYVIRDKRYRMEEISKLIEGTGFSVERKAYVRAGHFDEELEATDGHAKEILIIARKQ